MTTASNKKKRPRKKTRSGEFQGGREPVTVYSTSRGTVLSSVFTMPYLEYQRPSRGLYTKNWPRSPKASAISGSTPNLPCTSRERASSRQALGSAGYWRAGSVTKPTRNTTVNRPSGVRPHVSDSGSVGLLFAINAFIKHVSSERKEPRIIGLNCVRSYKTLSCDCAMKVRQQDQQREFINFSFQSLRRPASKKISGSTLKVTSRTEPSP